MQDNEERVKFEKWYCDDAISQGVDMSEGIAHLREGKYYGSHRVMLNGKWEGWQTRAALAS